MAIATETDDPTPPCGACRQVLREFADTDLPIWIVGRGERVEEFTLEDLLPRSFSTYLDEESK